MCAVGVWEVMSRLSGLFEGSEQTGLRGVGQTLDDVPVEAQVLFGGSDSQPTMKAFADSEVELARGAALGQRLRDILAVRLEVSHRVPARASGGIDEHVDARGRRPASLGLVYCVLPGDTSWTRNGFITSSTKLKDSEETRKLDASCLRNILVVLVCP